MNSTNVNEVQANGQQKIIQFVEKQPRKAEWIWFMAAGWKLDYQNGESALRNDIHRVLTKEIPKFESSLKAL